MGIESMIIEGLYLMMTGMGFVLFFLTILVLLLYIMEKVVGVEQAEASVPDQSHDSRSNQTLTAVISAAIHQHRQSNRQ